MFQSLIVGFGRAGNHLHLHCLRKARKLYLNEQIFGDIIGIVDPKIVPAAFVHEDTVRVFNDLMDVQGFDPALTVVHVCTPPADHLAVIRRIAGLGYTKIIIEKPMVMSMREVEEIRRLQEKWHLDLLVVAVWLSSALTKWLRDVVDSNRFGPLLQLTFEQHKPRFLRTLRDSGHTTAFDVELPHQVALALYLVGQEAQVIDAACTDMNLGAKAIPYMGGARMTMLHVRGAHSFLSSNLTAQSRRRFVKLSFRDHTVEGCFPASREISYSHLTVYDSHHNILESNRLDDDPLTTCFREYYSYYIRDDCRPVSDLHFNTIVISALTQARVLSGVPILGELNFKVSK